MIDPRVEVHPGFSGMRAGDFPAPFDARDTPDGRISLPTWANAALYALPSVQRRRALDLAEDLPALREDLARRPEVYALLSDLCAVAGPDAVTDILGATPGRSRPGFDPGTATSHPRAPGAWSLRWFFFLTPVRVERTTGPPRS